MRKIVELLTILSCIGIFACKSNGTRSTSSQVVRKPNIVFVLSDQWRAQATGYNSDSNLIGKTPNLDKMAAEGVNFRNAVSVTPVCTPYRAALLTGKFPTTTGMIFNDLHLPEQHVTMAELFKEAGYQTGYIGKWHLDGMGRSAYTPPERRQGFDYWKALECSHQYTDLLYYEGNSSEKKRWDGYGPYAETRDAISYIRRNAESEKPFLLVLAWGAPHFPYHNTPDETQKLFDSDDIILRTNVTEEQEEEAKRQSAGYYAHISALDKCMGKLTEAIVESGISENTIFIFTSDHGEMMGSHGVWPRQKQVPWAESIMVPFLLRYPAKYRKNIEVEVPINTPDILPTLLSLAGLCIPADIEGRDMTPAINSTGEASDSVALVMNVSPFAVKEEEYRGVYTSRYAYIENLKGPWLLFDNLKDPFQMNNLIGKPGYQQLQLELEEALKKELDKVGDKFMPRQHYIDKWKYKLTKGGFIDYSEGAEFQGPDLNR